MDRHRKKQVSLFKKPKKGRKKKAGFGLPFFVRILTRVSCYPVMFMRLVILRALARRIQLFFKLVLFVIKVQPRDLTFESCCFCV